MRSNSVLLPKRTHYAMSGGFQSTSRTNVRYVTLTVNTCAVFQLAQEVARKPRLGSAV